MKRASLERVFGRSRLKMVTGRYVEVYREAAAPGERRRYTKRFLATKDGDFRVWTQREWRILARLVGHGARHVPDIVQYHRGTAGGEMLVQTYDAGVTVDHWARLLPVQRDGRVQRHIFQDCAHWWALARHLLLALHEIHALRLVHLDLKADNICLPLASPDVDLAAPELRLLPAFENIALIDLAFAVVSGETLTSPLPLGLQQVFRYQSPRLLKALVAGQNGDLEPTQQLDWRCDMYSLAALLKAFLPTSEALAGVGGTRGWTPDLRAEAKALLSKIRESHDGDVVARLPHAALAAACAVQLARTELADSLQRSWTVIDAAGVDDPFSDAMLTAPLTRATLIEPQPVYTAPTEVLPLPPTDSPLGSDAVAEPSARPIVVAPEEPAAADAFPVAPDETSRVEDAPPTAPTVTAGGLPPLLSPTWEPGPATPSSRQPPAPARGPNRATRTGAVYVLPALAVGAALAWWLVQDRKRPVDDLRASSSSRAGIDAASPTDTVASAPVPKAERPSGAAAQAPDVTPPTVAASPALPAVERPPALPPPALPSAGDVRESVTATADPEPAKERFEQRAQQNLDRVVSLVVASAEPRVAQALSIAGRARSSSDDRRTATAAASIGDGAFDRAGAALAATETDQARQFAAAARRAFYRQRSVVRAYQLQRQAFGAHPGDVEIAGNLARYALKMEPPRVEEARALAIYALALSTRARGRSRPEDWGNLAVASALSKRSSDARNAMLVLLSVSRDVNRSCRLALRSVASHGHPMRAPAEALLRRAQDRVDVTRARHCRLPAKWRER